MDSILLVLVIPTVNKLNRDSVQEFMNHPAHLIYFGISGLQFLALNLLCYGS